jgi:drug/metabolite transporter (DMT)-like permease
MIETRDFSFIHKYFISEKQESLLFLFVGIAAMAAALVFFFFIKGHPSFHKGAAIPLFAIGLIQLAVGFTVYARSDKQRLDVAYHIGTEPQGYVKNTELPRMQAVMRNFVIYRWVEIALVVAGLALAFVFRGSPDRSFLHGLGIALAIQAAIMLGADYFAEKRGGIYMNELNQVISG